MRILIFLHGTTVMHATATGKTREERVRQVRYQFFHPNNYISIHRYASYIPVGNAVEKLRKWQSQGADILYLSSHISSADVEKDRLVLQRFDFPPGQILYRRNGESYKDIIERIIPDILIEDDCESIGGEKEMAITFVRPEVKQKIHSVVIREFEGIDHLPDDMKSFAAKK